MQQQKSLTCSCCNNLLAIFLLQNSSTGTLTDWPFCFNNETVSLLFESLTRQLINFSNSSTSSTEQFVSEADTPVLSQTVTPAKLRLFDASTIDLLQCRFGERQKSCTLLTFYYILGLFS